VQSQTLLIVFLIIQLTFWISTFCNALIKLNALGHVVWCEMLSHSVIVYEINKINVMCSLHPHTHHFINILTEWWLGVHTFKNCPSQKKVIIFLFNFNIVGGIVSKRTQIKEIKFVHSLHKIFTPSFSNKYYYVCLVVCTKKWMITWWYFGCLWW